MRTISPTLTSLFNSTFKKLKNINFFKKISLTVTGMLIIFAGYSTNYTANNVTGNWSAASSWTPSGVPGASDNVTISQGNITLDGAFSITNITISGGTLKASSILTVNGNWIYNSGTFNNGSNTVIFGTGSSIAGLLTTNFYSVTINTTLATDIVSLNIFNVNIANALTLSKGIFKVGAADTVVMSTCNSNVAGTAGTIATTGINGADGGTFSASTGSCDFSVYTPVTFYNIVLNNGRDLNLQTAGVHINGTLFNLNFVNNGIVHSNSPIWGAASTLSINYSGNTYSPSVGKEWNYVGVGTIGTTAGYPNNVIITNNGIGNGNATGTNISTNYDINGTLTLGDGTTQGSATISAPAFVCGGIVIKSASLLYVNNATFTVNGNWLRQLGGSFTPGTGNVQFAAGTCSTPSTITGPSATGETFYQLAIINGAYVTLNSPATVNTLTLLTAAPGGILTSTPTNILTINNSAPIAIAGGYSGAFINGPITWTFVNGGNTYTFPVGVANCITSTYLPFSAAHSTGNMSGTYTVQAFASNCGGGTVTGPPSYILSTTEYWSLAVSGGGFSAPLSISVTRPAAILAASIIAEGYGATSSSNPYVSIGGTAASPSINSAITLVAAPRNVGPLYFAISSTCSNGTWTGATDTVWNNTGNWCVIPTATTDATIPVITTTGTNGKINYPTLTANAGNTNGYAKNVLIANGAALTIYTNGSLSIYGNISNSNPSTAPLFNAVAGTIVMAGSAAQTIGGSMLVSKTINNLTDSNTVGLTITAADSISITGQLGFGASTATLMVNGILSLVSNSLATAWVGILASGNSITYGTNGNIIVQRYFDNHRRWRFITAPIQTSTTTINGAWQEGMQSNAANSYVNNTPGFGTSITGIGGIYNSTLGFDQSPRNNSSMATIAGGTAGLTANIIWTGVPNTNTIKITNFATYPNNANNAWMLFVRGDRSYQIGVTSQYKTATPATLRSIGKLNTGNQSLTTYAASSGFTVIGNPYASAIDFNAIYTRNNTTAFASNTFYVWDPNIGSTANNSAGGTGGWVSETRVGTTYVYSPSGAVVNIGSLTDVQNGYIPSGAAFLVMGTATNVTKSNLIIESDKISTNLYNSDISLYRSVADNPVMLRTNLFAINEDSSVNYLADGVLNIFDDSYSNVVSLGKDVPKMANLNEYCAIVKNGFAMAIQKSAFINAGDTIHLLMSKLKKPKYSFEFSALNLNRTDLKAELIDSAMGTTTPINLGDSTITTINFSVNSTQPSTNNANRFSIIFKAAPGAVTFSNISATQQNKNIKVQWILSKQLNIKEYVVETSTDNINFKDVDTTLATTATTYNWIDTNASTGIHYYRIRSVDNTYATQKSNTVFVTIYKGIVSGIAIYPNPVVGGAIGLQMNNIPIGEYAIEVINSVGQVVFSGTINHTVISATQNIYLNKSTAKGVYILTVKNLDNMIEKITFLNQ